MSNNYKTIDEMVEIFRKTYSSKLSEKLEKAAAEFAKKQILDISIRRGTFEKGYIYKYRHFYNNGDFSFSAR